jgi:putative ubiquitin-RnfH superfamily antitoxin RatB of RatAB toxin-antitoxin module
MTSSIAVELVYCSPTRQHVFTLHLPAGSTVRDAISSSRLLVECPELAMSTMQVGIHARIVGLDSVLREADRVEVYRPLVADPKQARRRRASAQR